MYIWIVTQRFENTAKIYSCMPDFNNCPLMAELSGMDANP